MAGSEMAILTALSAENKKAESKAQASVIEEEAVIQ